MKRLGKRTVRVTVTDYHASRPHRGLHRARDCLRSSASDGVIHTNAHAASTNTRPCHKRTLCEVVRGPTTLARAHSPPSIQRASPAPSARKPSEAGRRASSPAAPPLSRPTPNAALRSFRRRLPRSLMLDFAPLHPPRSQSPGAHLRRSRPPPHAFDGLHSRRLETDAASSHPDAAAAERKSPAAV